MYAVIMAGGSGTRFWPLSRRKTPKQLLNLTGSETLIEGTVNRILPIIPIENIFIVTIESQKKMIAKCLPDIPQENIIAEPCARNTAPAIGLAALHVRRKDPEGVMVVLPADHLVKEEKRFRTALKYARTVAEKNNSLVTIGLSPTYPETGYGYIQSGTLLKESRGKKAFAIKRFTEKPDKKTAKRFVSRKDYFWNGGIFIWKAATILAEMEENMPALSIALQTIDAAMGKRNEKLVLKKTYEKLEKISIDYGVMEKTKKGAVIPCDVGWNDVGSWLALADVLKKDKDGNVSTGNFLSIDSDNCIIHSKEKLVTGIGIKDLVVVSTPDAILICPKNDTQRVKEMVELLEKKKMDTYL